MNRDEKRAALAKLDGWERLPDGGWVEKAYQLGNALYFEFEPPDYMSDLNAMHKVIRNCGKMGLTRCDRFGELLTEITMRDFGQKSENKENPYLAEMYAWDATADQRAEAILKTFNLWTDE